MFDTLQDFTTLEGNNKNEERIGVDNLAGVAGGRTPDVFASRARFS
jgi:hypothetical protein